MAQTTHPPKELVRKVMACQREQRAPPMSPEQLRRELGWGLVSKEVKAR
jgi:hypothetical protein